MSQPFLGEIKMFGCNFAPRSWAMCNGQLMSIAQNNALFALLGTQYGGDGVQTFALPDLRGRLPLNQGQGPGLTNRVIGESSGTETVTVLQSQLPSHIHALNARSSPADRANPNGASLAVSQQPAYTAPSSSVTMRSGGASTTGGSQPHNNVQPFLAINFCIALNGIFPSRS